MRAKALYQGSSQSSGANVNKEEDSLGVKLVSGECRTGGDIEFWEQCECPGVVMWLMAAPKCVTVSRDFSDWGTKTLIVWVYNVPKVVMTV